MKLTVDSSVWATNRNKDAAEGRIKASLEYLTDPNKKERISLAVECKWCFYFCSQRIGGTAMTKWNCGICDKEDMSGSTHCKKVCKECGVENELCTECGGDLHLRVTRRFK